MQAPSCFLPTRTRALTFSPTQTGTERSEALSLSAPGIRPAGVTAERQTPPPMAAPALSPPPPTPQASPSRPSTTRRQTPFPRPRRARGRFPGSLKRERERDHRRRRRRRRANRHPLHRRGNAHTIRYERTQRDRRRYRYGHPRRLHRKYQCSAGGPHLWGAWKRRISTMTITTSDGVASDVDTVSITVTAQPPQIDLDADDSSSGPVSASDNFSSNTYTGASGGVIPWAGP